MADAQAHPRVLCRPMAAAMDAAVFSSSDEPTRRQYSGTYRPGWLSRSAMHGAGGVRHFVAIPPTWGLTAAASGSCSGCCCPARSRCCAWRTGVRRAESTGSGEAPGRSCLGVAWASATLAHRMPMMARTSATIPPVRAAARRPAMPTWRAAIDAAGPGHAHPRYRLLTTLLDPAVAPASTGSGVPPAPGRSKANSTSLQTHLATRRRSKTAESPRARKSSGWPGTLLGALAAASGCHAASNGPCRRPSGYAAALRQAH